MKRIIFSLAVCLFMPYLAHGVNETKDGVRQDAAYGDEVLSNNLTEAYQAADIVLGDSIISIVNSQVWSNAQYPNAVLLDGSRTMTDNLRMGGKWLSHDGDDEGLRIDTDGGARFSGYVSIWSILFRYGDLNTQFGFGDDSFWLDAGGEGLIYGYEGTQDFLRLGDGGDIDINVNSNWYVWGDTGNLDGRGNTASNYFLGSDIDIPAAQLTGNISTNQLADAFSGAWDLLDDWIGTFDSQEGSYYLDDANTTNRAANNTWTTNFTNNITMEGDLDVAGTIKQNGTNVLVDSDIESTVQAWDDDLDDIAGLSHTANYLMQSDGTDWTSVATIAFTNDPPGIAYSDASSNLAWMGEAWFKSAFNLETGTDVQAWSTNLDAWATIGTNAGIDESNLDASVNTSLDLADTSIQPSFFQYAAIELPSAGSYTQTVATATTNILIGMSQQTSSAGFSTSVSNITVGAAGAGVCKVILSGSWEANLACLAHIHLYTNGTHVSRIGISEDSTVASSQAGNSYSGYITLANGAIVDMRLEHDNGAARTFSFDHLSLIIEKRDY